MENASFGYIFVGIVVPLLFVVLAMVGTYQERREACEAAIVEAHQKGLYEYYWFGEQAREEDQEKNMDTDQNSLSEADSNKSSTGGSDENNNLAMSSSDAGWSDGDVEYVRKWLEKDDPSDTPSVMPTVIEMDDLSSDNKATATAKPKPQFKKVKNPYSSRVEDADEDDGDNYGEDKPPSYRSSSVYSTQGSYRGHGR